MLRAMMALASLSFVACAFPLSLAWFFVWRFLSGFSGAVVMVLVAQAILPLVAPARRGFASGAIFIGIGVGIVAFGTLVPLLLHLGLAATWLGLGLCSAILTALTWCAWPAHAAGPAASTAAVPRPAPLPGPVRILYAAYAAVAVGLVPTAVFLVNFVARGLKQGAAQGATYWIVYGVGALFGPLLYGAVADRIGFARALRLGLVLCGIASALLALVPNTAVLVCASFLIGAFTPGVVTLMIGRLHEMMPGNQRDQHAAWSRSTTIFALFQAISGYGFSFLFSHSGGQYRLIYLIAAGAFGVAVIAEIAAGTKKTAEADF